MDNSMEYNTHNIDWLNSETVTPIIKGFHIDKYVCTKYVCGVPVRVTVTVQESDEYGKKYADYYLSLQFALKWGNSNIVEAGSGPIIGLSNDNIYTDEGDRLILETAEKYISSWEVETTEELLGNLRAEDFIEFIDSFDHCPICGSPKVYIEE